VLDKRSRLPLHQQLKAAIEERILSGEWQPGAQVPSERELCEQYAISRITVRQALAALVMEGRLIRVQGRGTFVASPRIEQQLTHLTGFTQDMQARGKRPSARLLEAGSIAALPMVARALKIRAGESVIMLKRLRLADGEPMAIETAYLLESRCQGILKEKLAARSLYDVLAKKYRLNPARALQQMEAIACPAAEAKLLDTRRGAPVLHIHRTTYDRDGRPFELVESFYRGDRYTFYAELHGDGLAGDALRPGEVA
jgi:GntR family transcriptional regulator